MANQGQIADFIFRRMTLGRVQPGRRYWFGNWAYRTPLPYWGPALPRAEQIAFDLIQDAEFRALQLGGFLKTPTGEFLQQAVEIAIPRAFVPEFQLIVDAFTLAADLQQGQARGRTILAVGGGLLIALLLTSAADAA